MLIGRFEFVTNKKLQKILGMSRYRIGKLARHELCQEGLHWIRPTGQEVLWNASLMINLAMNAGKPEAHKKAIADFRGSVPAQLSFFSDEVIAS